MLMLHQTSVKIAVLLHKQAKVPFVLDLAVHNYSSYTLKNGFVYFDFDPL